MTDKEYFDRAVERGETICKVLYSKGLFWRNLTFVRVDDKYMTFRADLSDLDWWFEDSYPLLDIPLKFLEIPDEELVPALQQERIEMDNRKREIELKVEQGRKARLEAEERSLYKQLKEKYETKDSN